MVIMRIFSITWQSIWQIGVIFDFVYVMVENMKKCLSFGRTTDLWQLNIGDTFTFTKAPAKYKTILIDERQIRQFLMAFSVNLPEKHYN
jgi:hypothetical protein